MGSKRNMELPQEPVPFKKRKTCAVGAVRHRKRGSSESSTGFRDPDSGYVGASSSTDRLSDAILDTDVSKRVRRRGLRDLKVVPKANPEVEEDTKMDPLSCIAAKLRLKMGVHSVARVKKLMGKVADTFAHMKLASAIEGGQHNEGVKVEARFPAADEDCVSSTSDGIQA